MKTGSGEWAPDTKPLVSSGFPPLGIEGRWEFGMEGPAISDQELRHNFPFDESLPSSSACQCSGLGRLSRNSVGSDSTSFVT